MKNQLLWKKTFGLYQSKFKLCLELSKLLLKSTGQHMIMICTITVFCVISFHQQQFSWCVLMTFSVQQIYKMSNNWYKQSIKQCWKSCVVFYIITRQHHLLWWISLNLRFILFFIHWPFRPWVIHVDRGMKLNENMFLIFYDAHVHTEFMKYLNL